jgi:hypothetical protein
MGLAKAENIKGLMHASLWWVASRCEFEASLEVWTLSK